MGGQDEVDPLDAFMAEVHQEMKSQELQPKAVRLSTASRCDEGDDPVAEFMEVWLQFDPLSSVSLFLCEKGTKRARFEFGNDGSDEDWDTYAARSQGLAAVEWHV